MKRFIGLKIVLISQNVSPGILVFRRDFISYLVENGHDVYCFAIDYTEESKSLVTALGAIPMDYQLDKTGLNPLSDIKNTFQLYREIKDLRPDVVFGFFVKPSIYGTIAARMAKVPRRIAMLEGLGYIHTPTPSGFTFKKKILQLAHGFLVTVGYAFADKVLFLNPDDPLTLSRKSLLKKSKIHVLGPIGLNLNDYPYSPVRENCPVRFVFVARLLAEKGIFEYIEAARKVKKLYPESEFVVLGGLDPENPAALTKEQLQAVVAEGVIIYPGHVSNVQEWIAGSHVFVLPSYREGVPRSTQEAMAIGRAVITTDVPGCRETVVDGVNGFMVPPWDSQELVDKMIYFIENRQEIRRMGDNSYRLAVERYDIQKINPVLESILIGE